MSEGQGFAKRVTRENLTAFAPLLKPRRAATSSTDDNYRDEDEANTTPPDSAVAQTEALFAGQRVIVRLPFQRPTRGGQTGGRRRRRLPPLPPLPVEPPPQGPAPTPPVERRVIFRWSKRLSNSDVNKNERNERNLMSLGVGRGKKARVMEGIDDIRNKMMADEQWSDTQVGGEDAEIANVSFEVHLPGEQPQHHTLEVVHAPHRGSGQYNYHTSIRWDTELARVLREAPGSGFAGYWAILDKYDSSEYVLTITTDKPDPQGIGLK
jgi:hypothetical protein